MSPYRENIRNFDDLFGSLADLFDPTTIDESSLPMILEHFDTFKPHIQYQVALTLIKETLFEYIDFKSCSHFSRHDKINLLKALARHDHLPKQRIAKILEGIEFFDLSEEQLHDLFSFLYGEVWSVNEIVKTVATKPEERLLRYMLDSLFSDELFWKTLLLYIDQLRLMMTDEEWVDFLAKKLMSGDSSQVVSIMNAFQSLQRFSETEKMRLLYTAGRFYPQAMIVNQHLWLPFVEGGREYLKSLELLDR